MAKNYFNYLGIVLIAVFGILKTDAQTCDAGDDIIVFDDFDFPFEFDDCQVNGSEVDLDAYRNNALGLSKVTRTKVSSNVRWELKEAPEAPRGKRKVDFKDVGKVDFPNTGAGLPEKYIFEYIVTDAGCEDRSTIELCIDSESTDPSIPNESSIIYICDGESIQNKSEFFNSLPLERVRVLTNEWKQILNDTPSSFNYPIEDAGIFEYEDDTTNILRVEVIKIDCSTKDIHFSFANATTTNDGTDDYYEVDVMVQSTNTTGIFPIRNGKLFFNYNTEAFGEYANLNSRIEVTYPDGYIASQKSPPNFNSSYYRDFKIYDNTNNDSKNRFSWKFSTNNVDVTDINLETPKKLCHIKIKYLDAHKPHDFKFEENGIYDNQFLAQGQPELITNDSFDSNGATLSNKSNPFSNNLFIYPNPTEGKLEFKGNIAEIKSIQIFSITGQELLQFKRKLNTVNISHLKAGIYFIKVNSVNNSKTFKVIKK